MITIFHLIDDFISYQLCGSGSDSRRQNDKLHHAPYDDRQISKIHWPHESRESAWSFWARRLNDEHNILGEKR